MSTALATGSERLFSKRAILAAVIGGVVLVVWVIVAMQLLSFTGAFLQADLREPRAGKAGDFAEWCTSAFVSGMLFGFVVYQLWRSSRRDAILRWMLIWGVGGTIVGAIAGAVCPLEWRLTDVTDARLLLVLHGLIWGGVTAASISALFTSNKRRVILKSLFLPAALGLTLRTVSFSSFPLGVVLLHDVVQTAGGRDVAAPFLVGIVLAWYRWWQRRKASVQTPPGTAQPTPTP